MKRLVFASALVGLLLVTSVAFAGDRVIAVFADGTPGVEKENIVMMNGGTVVKQLGIINGVVLTLPDKASDKARAAILAHNKVVIIESDAVATAVAKPDTPPGKPDKPDGGEDPPPPQELPWGVDRIDAEFAWTASAGLGVKVAVIDTGIDLNHPDLTVYGDVNIISSRKSGNDDNGHGTHCAGIIAALNNELGVVGVAPEAHLYAVKVLDRKGSGWTSDIIAGIEWAVQNKMGVASLSLGSSTGSTLLWDAVKSADAAGVIIVAAAGNNGGPVIYPAAYPEAIAVSSTGDY